VAPCLILTGLFCLTSAVLVAESAAGRSVWDPCATDFHKNYRTNSEEKPEVHPVLSCAVRDGLWQFNSNLAVPRNLGQSAQMCHLGEVPQFCCNSRFANRACRMAVFRFWRIVTISLWIVWRAGEAGEATGEAFRWPSSWRCEKNTYLGQTLRRAPHPRSPLQYAKLAGSKPPG
jgi:hypothetical protein